MNQAILKILDDLVVDELKDGTITYNLGYNRAIEDAQDKILDLPSDTQWIDVKERLPENENFVLGTYINSYGRSRVIRCLYTKKFQTEITENLDDDYGDYCEEKDAVFFPEGWYEANETDENYYNPDGEVTHWQPLPTPPNN